jgi:peroxiredoxin
LLLPRSDCAPHEREQRKVTEGARDLPWDLERRSVARDHLEAAKAFHVAYHVDDATFSKMREYGVDLEGSTGTKQHELPVPSVFIIDTSGTIRFVYSNPDYKD